MPFLDKELLCFAYNLPMSVKLKDGTNKWVLREAFRGELPDRTQCNCQRLVCRTVLVCIDCYILMP